jgi:hypothetical protein
MNIEIHPNSNIEINEMGLKLDIKPMFLISKLMDQNGRNMFKEMLQYKFESILQSLLEDKLKIESGSINSKNVENKTIILKSVLEFATFIRQISTLSTEFELDIIYETLPKDKKEAYDWAFSLIRYSSQYGYREIINTKIDF